MAKKAAAKAVKRPKRPMLTDRGIAVFWKGLKEDYPSVTLADVRSIAGKVHNGTYSDTCVISVLMAAAIDDALEAGRHKR